MNYENEKINVSRETYNLLKRYEKLLCDWQKKINLVSKSSLEDSWNRHFLDSIQLYNYIPEKAKTLCDFGSGAGFPGMVLAIMSQERTPYLKVNLVESIGKKTLFLNEVKKNLEIDVNIIKERIEKLPSQKFDIITSRAMTSLDNLLSYAYRFCKKETICIFPKGKSFQEELYNARKMWNFDCQIHDNTQNPEGKILIINHLAKNKGEK